MNIHPTTPVLALALSILALSCSGDKKQQATHQIQEIDISMVSNHIEQLASDEFLGRKPFTEGETKTINYLVSEFEKLGLQGGNAGSFTQDVPMVEINGTCSKYLTITGNRELQLKHFDDFVATCPKPTDSVSLQASELVFAGYGIVAPEYGRNDYEGIDWTGKTALVLVNDPGFESGDSSLFKGNEMTYYGRWTYKFEEAARQGCAGVLIIHQTQPASYGWNVVQSGWNGAQLSLESTLPKVDVAGWISEESAQQLLENTQFAGRNLRELARNKDFKAAELGLKLDLTITNSIRRDVSQNVLAMIPGTELKDEFIIYTAHWDHFGVGIPINGDSIYNGAIDNASGTAALLGIADAMLRGGPLKRSVLFMAVTGEEQGLLGSKYYSEHPVIDPVKTVAVINMDAFSAPAPMKDLTIRGFGQSELDDYATRAAQKQGRYVMPDPDPQKGFFFRSDHFNFAKIGIPALYAKGDFEAFDYGKDFVKQKKDQYTKSIYHQPFDEYAPDSVQLAGIKSDIALMLEVGVELANSNNWPKWRAGSEFKAIREKSLEGTLQSTE